MNLQIEAITFKVDYKVYPGFYLSQESERDLKRNFAFIHFSEQNTNTCRAKKISERWSVVDINRKQLFFIHRDSDLADIMIYMHKLYPVEAHKMLNKLFLSAHSMAQPLKVNPQDN